MSILKRVEKELDNRLRHLFSPERAQGEKKEFLEIYHAVLEDVAAHVQKLPRGRRAFPYNTVTVELSPDHATLTPQDELLADIREALAGEECDSPKDLQVKIAPSGAAGFRVVYSNTRRTQASTELPKAHFAVIKGKAERDEYTLARARINVGRLPDVVDDQQRLTRRNEIFFPEGADPVNATVSRAHAHIRFDPEAGEFRVYDDRSAYGTSVFRDGTPLTVPPGPGRGIALRDGDEIYFGQAGLRFHR